MERLQLALIILGAGASSRMGGKPKLLLPWESSCILRHQLDLWKSLSVGRIAVVCSHQNQPLYQEVFSNPDEVCFVVNPEPNRGMFSSIQCAAAWSGWPPETTHWIITPGDHPLIRKQTLSDLLKFASEHADAISQPSFKGRAAHPVILPKWAFEELPGSHCENLKMFLQSHAGSIRMCPSSDPGLKLDIDTPEDYERALRLIKEGKGG